MKPNIATVTFKEGSATSVGDGKFFKYLASFITAHIASDTTWTIGQSPLGFSSNIPVANWGELRDGIMRVFIAQANAMADQAALPVPLPVGFYPFMIGLTQNYVRTENGTARFAYTLPANEPLTEEVTSSIFGPHGFFMRTGHKMYTGTDYLTSGGRPKPSEGFTPDSTTQTTTYGVTLGSHVTDFYMSSDEASDLAKTVAASIPPFAANNKASIKGVVNMRKDLKYSVPAKVDGASLDTQITALRCATVALAAKERAIPVCHRMTTTQPNSSLVIDFARTEYLGITNDDEVLLSQLPPLPLSLDAIGLLQCSASASVDPMVFLTSLQNSTTEDLLEGALFSRALQFVRVAAEFAPYVDVPATFAESLVAHTSYLGVMRDGRYVLSVSINRAAGDTSTRAAQNTRTIFERCLGLLAIWFKSDVTYDGDNLNGLHWVSTTSGQHDGYRIMLELFSVTKANSAAMASSVLHGLLASYDDNGLYNPVSILVHEHEDADKNSDPTRPYGTIEYDGGSVSAGLSVVFSGLYADRLVGLPQQTNKLLVQLYPWDDAGTAIGKTAMDALIQAWGKSATAANTNTSKVKTYFTGRTDKEHTLLESLTQQCRFPVIDLSGMALLEDIDPDLSAVLPTSLANILNYTYLRSSNDPSFVIASSNMRNPRTGEMKTATGHMLRMATEGGSRFHIGKKMKKFFSSSAGRKFVNQLVTGVLPSMMSQVL